MQNRSFRATALENNFGSSAREQLWVAALGSTLDSFPDQLAASGSSNFEEQLSIGD